jgi:hypothetical protein
MYNNQPKINNSQLYVALRVTENYVTEHTATVRGIRGLRREASNGFTPRHKSPCVLLREGAGRGEEQPNYFPSSCPNYKFTKHSTYDFLFAGVRPAWYPLY